MNRHMLREWTQIAVCPKPFAFAVGDENLFREPFSFSGLCFVSFAIGDAKAQPPCARPQTPSMDVLQRIFVIKTQVSQYLSRSNAPASLFGKSYRSEEGGNGTEMLRCSPGAGRGARPISVEASAE